MRGAVDTWEVLFRAQEHLRRLDQEQKGTLWSV
jgi:hypothetical protein